MKKCTLRNLKMIFICCCLAGGATTLNAQHLDWAKQASGPNFEDARAVSTDTAGNVYTVGRFKQTVDFDPGTGVYTMTATGTAYNTYILKLSASGDFIWAKQFEGAATEVKAMVADSAGNVYVTGFKGPTGGATDFDPGVGVANLTVTGAISNTDIFVVKLNTAGNLEWVRQMGGTTTDQATAIAVDPNGNVFTTGYFRGTADFNPGTAVNNLVAGNTGGDVFISKLDPAGNYIWAKNIGGTGSSSCSASDIKVDAAGNVYVSGAFGGTIDFDPGTTVQTMSTVMGEFAFVSNIFVFKLNSDGNYAWAKNAGRSIAAGNPSCNLALDNFGSIYLAGGFSDTVDFDPGPGTANLVSTLTGVSDVDIFISKLDTSGNYIWAKKIGSIGIEAGRPMADDFGKIYIIGRFAAPLDFDPSDTGVFEMNTTSLSGALFVSRLDSAGNFEWAVSIDANGASLTSNGLGVALNRMDKGIQVVGDFTNTMDFDPGTDTLSLSALGSGDIFLLKLKNCFPVSSLVNTTACDSFSFNGVSYNLTGTYHQNYLTQNGCDSIVTLQLTINNKPDVTVTATGATLSANTSAATYQWLNCNGNSLIPGATQQSYTAGTQGSYAVIVTKNGCYDTSDCYNVAITAITEMEASTRFNVYPNPAKGQLIIAAAQPVHNAALKLIDITGRVMLSQVHVTLGQTLVDISGIAPGLYILELTAEHKVYRLKVIKE